MARIALDPGHGGDDSGAVGNAGLNEKNVNLVVAYLVKEHLEAAGHAVMMTRTSDVWYGPGVSADLNTRCQKINDWGADLAVSIHVNSGGGHYISTFIQGPGGEAEKLAGKVQAAMVAAIGWQDAGVKVENLAMTRETECPACLVEMGFIDDTAQEAALGATETQKAFAQAIATGIVGYLGGELKEAEPVIDWAKWYLDELKKKGILNGDHKSDDPITFGQVAVLLCRLLKFLGKL